MEFTVTLGVFAVGSNIVPSKVVKSYFPVVPEVD